MTWFPVPVRLNFLRIHLGVVLGLLAFGLHAEPRPGQWTQDYEAALSVASERKLPLLLKFTGSDWCDTCLRMESRVFRNPEWEAFSRERLLLVTLDFPKGETEGLTAAWRERNARLQREFQISVFPTYVLLDHDGQTQLGALWAPRRLDVESFVRDCTTLLRRGQVFVERLVQAIPEEAAKGLLESFQASRARRRELDSWVAGSPEPGESAEMELKRLIQRVLDADREFNAKLQEVETMFPEMLESLDFKRPEDAVKGGAGDPFPVKVRPQ